MKLTPARAEAFVAGPPPAVRAVLVFGPDQGLIRDRVEQLIAATVGRPADPFRYCEIAAATIRADPVRLADEAAALAFAAGRRVVRIREATDALASAFAAAIPAAAATTLLVAEAGDLPKHSRLRRLFEDADAAAALPCYQEDEAGLRKLVEQNASGHRLRISPEAVDALLAQLGPNRALLLGELNKLLVYKGEPGTIDADDVLAVVGDAADISLGAAAFAAAGGEIRELERTLTVAFAEALSPVSLLRATAQHLQRLLQAGALVAAGATAKQAMAALKPPVFFRLEPAFRKQMETWSRRRLAVALGLATDGELRCKQTGTPAELLCSRTLLQIAEMARRSRQPDGAGPPAASWRSRRRISSS